MRFEDWDFAVLINACEVMIWVGLAVVVALRPLFPPVQPAQLLKEARLRRWMAIALVLFGLSDAVEIGSGAWWRPWWLLAWKATCVIAISVIGSVLYLRSRERDEKDLSA
ncbi:hypothetical protein Spb1_37750 [Planctopirus ephydatiae]|jgi:hypothetical protein|uniref:Uncharacterized protein n=1 Tax=Planctopirus ephydatiae TaxID=2528019 RepID=A0A518GTC1_9PLAN|nr:hypothetical protein [Planctopirus ephydatiae]QDV31830.1 hypothetical protein Spb1_37750 [Planctopirus ephydatiae]